MALMDFFFVKDLMMKTPKEEKNCPEGAHRNEKQRRALSSVQMDGQLVFSREDSRMDIDYQSQRSL